MLLITCGGYGARLDTFNGPKCLAPIPIYNQNGTETILDRQLRQLTELGVVDQVHLLLGFQADMVKKKYPDLKYFMITDPNHPKNIVSGIADFLNQYAGTRYTFLLGDTVWHTQRLAMVFDRMEHPRGITYFASMNHVGGETFAVRVFNDTGDGYFRRICTEKPDIISPFGKKSQLTSRSYVKTMPFENARLNDFFSHMLVHLDPNYRKTVVKPVEDIDNPEEWEEIGEMIKKGVFDDRN